MIYELVIRPSYNKVMTSDQLIWVESDLPSRAFEQWLKSKNLIDGSNRAPLVRWGIVQTQKSANFQMSKQEVELSAKIAELMSGAAHLIDLPMNSSLSIGAKIAA